jgi:hypothetical protein
MGTKLTDAIGVSVQNVNKTVGNEYAVVTRVNTNQTVNLKPIADDPELDDLINIPVLVNVDLSVNDKVLLTYLDNNINNPAVIGMMSPKSSSGGIGADINPIDILNKLKTVDGSGSGLDADLLDGQELSYITGLINAKLDSSTYTANDILSKLLGVDGAGSGLDADKLDGYNAQDLIDLIGNGLSGTFQLKKLITEVDVSNVSSYTLSNINGNDDGIYILEYDLSYSPGVTGDVSLTLKPNNLTTDQVSSSFRAGGGWHGADNTVGSLRINLGYSTATRFKGKVEINAETGKNRTFTTIDAMEIRGTTESYINYFNGFWKNTTTNITSLVLAISTGTFSGKIRLYKMIDIEL